VIENSIYLLIYLFGFLVSLFCIRKSPRVGGDYFDMSMFFLIPPSLSMIALLSLTVINFDLTILKDHWLIFKSKDVLFEVSLLHLILNLSFALTYLMTTKFFYRNKVLRGQEISKNFSGLTPWILLFIPITYLYVVMGFPEIVDPSALKTHGLIHQFSTIVTKIFGLTLVVIMYLFVSKITGRLYNLISLFSIVFITSIIFFYFGGTRGGLVNFIIVASLLDTYKYQGNFINKKLAILIFLGGAFLYSLINFIESYIYGDGNIWFLLHVYEYQVFENTAKIFNSVSQNSLTLFDGKSFVNAFLGLIPYQLRPIEIVPLHIWYLENYIPEMAGTGYGAAFSAIAEGYMNFKNWGVLLIGITFGLIASILKIIRYKFGFIGGLIYASSVPLGYKMFRTDLRSIMFQIELGIIIVIVTVILIWMIRILLMRSHFAALKYKK
jgi:hypothetical protein